MRLTLFLFALLAAVPSVFAAEQLQLRSPDGKLTVAVALKDGRVGYSLHRGETTLLKWAPLGLTIDGVDSGAGVKSIALAGTGGVQTRTFAVTGVKSQAKVPFAEYRVTGLNGRQTLDFCVFNDGIAFRYLFPAKPKARVNSEQTAFGLSPDATVWTQESASALWSVEGTFRASKMGDFTVPSDEELAKWNGDWNKNPYRSFLRSGPVTAVLPDNTYLLLQEAGNFNLDWCGLKYAFKGDKIEALYFHNRDGFDIGKNSTSTPWRVIVAAADLNALVNADIVGAVVPAPDKKLFPKGAATDWIKPGRSTWTWWSTRGAAYDDQIEFIDMAAEFGFEYHLVDEGYEHWKADKSTKYWNGAAGKDWWDMLEAVVRHGKKKGVKIWIWRHWDRGGFNNPDKDYQVMREFFKKAKSIGVVGLKIDFMDRDSQDRLRFYDAGLRIGAENKLMINYHGANTPGGENFTWPNEMSREGIFGLEQNQQPATHITALPFTRLAAGHGDFTPGYFGHDTNAGFGKASWSLNLAQLIVYTSPAQHVVSKPADIRAAAPEGSLQREVLKSFPSVWDETRVLPGAAIGEYAPFARRKGNDWYLAAINGREGRDDTVKLDFLKPGTRYQAILIEDNPEKPDAWNVSEKTVTAGDIVSFKMRGAGGFVARFVPVR